MEERPDQANLPILTDIPPIAVSAHEIRELCPGIRASRKIVSGLLVLGTIPIECPASRVREQFDGPDHDRGQPAAVRGISLPPGHRAVRTARPDCAGEPRLELEEPGPHGRIAPPL